MHDERTTILLAALRELAANRHSFRRPAGQIAREALEAYERAFECPVCERPIGTNANCDECVEARFSC